MIDRLLRPETDSSHADWWLDQLEEWGRHGIPTAAFVPRSLPCVAMVLHPWWDHRRSDGEDVVTWAQVATATGLSDRPALHEALVDWLYRRDDPGVELVDLRPYEYPLEGMLDSGTGQALGAVLSQATATPQDIFVGFWEGGGDIDPDTVPTAARIPTASRGHRLLRGPLESVVTALPRDAGTSHLGPGPVPGHALEQARPLNGIWWPADRAWLVHTDVDLPLTHVGGSESLVTSLVEYPDLEVVIVDHDAPANRVPA